ncbi:MAG: hypothetical protein FWD05_09140 [Oscillospiraceae bacterium]|nr:hypothetical protein [Oscillospiraceae bacterium]
MSNLTEIKNISLDFRRLSSNFLKTTYDDNFLYIKRLYNFIEENQEIKKIIDTVISTSDYDCEQFVTQSDYGDYQINVPINETDHIKALYGFLEKLAVCQENMHLAGIAMTYGYHKDNFNEIIRCFLEDIFKPLIDFIVDSLSKQMMALEQNQSPVQVTQNIKHNHGTANVGESITSTNLVQQNDLREVIEQISELKAEIISSGLGNDEKESALDDLEVIREQLASDAPQKVRLKKAISGFITFVTAVGSGITVRALTSPTFITRANELIERLKTLLDSI